MCATDCFSLCTGVAKIRDGAWRMCEISDKRDKKAIVAIVFFGIYTFIGGLMGEMHFSYFPSIQSKESSVFGVSVFVAYLILCMLPIIIEISEVRRWKALRSKI